MWLTTPPPLQNESAKQCLTFSLMTLPNQTKLIHKVDFTSWFFFLKNVFGHKFFYFFFLRILLVTSFHNVRIIQYQVTQFCIISSALALVVMLVKNVWLGCKYSRIDLRLGRMWRPLTQSDDPTQWDLGSNQTWKGHVWIQIEICSQLLWLVSVVWPLEELVHGLEVLCAQLHKWRWWEHPLANNNSICLA